LVTSRLGRWRGQRSSTALTQHNRALLIALDLSGAP
jgi:hypothetical protein